MILTKLHSWMHQGQCGVKCLPKDKTLSKLQISPPTKWLQGCCYLLLNIAVLIKLKLLFFFLLGVLLKYIVVYEYKWKKALKYQNVYFIQYSFKLCTLLLIEVVFIKKTHYFQPKSKVKMRRYLTLQNCLKLSWETQTCWSHAGLLGYFWS